MFVYSRHNLLVHNHTMITKTAIGSLDSRKSSGYFLEYDPGRQMTREQKKTLIGLIYSRVSNPDEIERRLSQIEDYSFLDATEAINDLLFCSLR